VADFGLSRKLDYTAMLRINSYGSVTHMPPELLTSGLLSRAADVYSLGVLMWQMYCCSRPWAGMRHVAIVHAVVHEGKRLTFPEGTPEAFASLASRCMASEPQARPTCEQVVEEVEAMMRVLVPVELEGEF
jgi:serine/threonine protein kinase